MALESLLVALGAFFNMALAAIGSTIGTYKAATSGVVAVAEDSENRTAALILSALPTTQTIYAFVIMFMVFLPILSTKVTLSKAIFLFALGLLYGVAGLASAYAQGKVAAAGISMLSKNKDYVQYLILASLVEFFALITFIVVLLFGQSL